MTPAANDFLRVDDLRVHFAGKRTLLKSATKPVRAVNGVSFTIPRGRTLGLVGESGSGKSTIARAILRLVPATSGEIRVGDLDVGGLSGSELKDYRKVVQVVFQDPYSSLNPSHTVSRIVGELITEHRGIKPGAERDGLVAELIDQVGLGRHMLERFPHELSGGQRQRVAIARALSVEPDLIVCDEATSALDVSIQSQVINLLKEIQQRTNVSYLFIAHDLAVVRHISHDTGVLYLGYLVEDGPADRVSTQPAHPYTAMLNAAEPVPEPSRQKELARMRRALAVEGEPPSPVDLPPGCPFASRCSLVMDICRQEMPDATAVDGGGTVRCHVHTSGPKLNGGSVLSLLNDRGAVEASSGVSTEMGEQ